MPAARLARRAFLVTICAAVLAVEPLVAANAVAPAAAPWGRRASGGISQPTQDGGTISIERSPGVVAESVDAGTVELGSSVTRTLSVRNTGSGPLTVSSATITTRSFADGEYRIVSEAATGQPIPPGQARQIVIAFEPRTGSGGPPDALAYLGSLPGYPMRSTEDISSATGVVEAIAVHTQVLNAGGSGPVAWTATATSGGMLRGQDRGTASLVGGDAYLVRVVGSVSGETTESRLQLTLPTAFSVTRVLRPAPPALTVPSFDDVREVGFTRLPDAVLVVESDDPAVAAGSIVGLFGRGVGTAAAPAPATAVARWSGADRYETAAAVSARSFPSGADVAFVATGENFPDALSGGPAAAALGGPILLTGRDRLPAATTAELVRLGPQRIVVLGGPSAVAEAVVRQLGSYASDGVARWSGADRYATAAVVSSNAFPEGATVAFLATAGNFPDALAGGPAGGALGGPILLTGRDTVPSVTLAELVRLQPDRLVVLGGHSVVADAVLDQLAPYTSDGVTRWSGPDRYATAAVVSSKSFPGGADVVFVATGASFPDALAGGPAGGTLGGPILLASRDGVPPATLAELARLGPARIVVLGGPSALPDTVLDQVAAYRSSQGRRS